MVRRWMIWVLVLAVWVSACGPAALPPASTTEAQGAVQETMAPLPTETPERPMYSPGELVDYVAQAGDTLEAIAVHFNTSVAEIRAANSFIPAETTTMPPGMPLKIPIYYAPFWGSTFQILPDSLFVNGPAQVGFDIETFVSSQPGWLSQYRGYAAGDTRSGANTVQLVAQNFSLSPRLLLALLEYQSGALSQDSPPGGSTDYVLGNPDPFCRGVYLQLVWAANLLNDAYYRWRLGELVTFEHLDGRVERPDPWQNAGSVALQVYFSQLVSGEAYLQVVRENGLAQTYARLFGDPWQNLTPHIPGSLQQPALRLPFEEGKAWSYTGGPHTAWGEGAPLAALDFAPGMDTGGCTPSDEWVTAVAAGVVTRSDPATVMLDLDMDGDERTGWVIFYFHLATEGRVPAGAVLQAGDRIGHPSCEGGRATGTHVHVARLYNGEWMAAAGTLAFNLEGWIAQNGVRPYLGTLKRNTQVVTASDKSDQYSRIEAGIH